MSSIHLSKNIFCLVDCNSFFASCEKVFRPSLKHQPVVVLSSNDGCVIARSEEAKSLGIPMGIAFFKVRELLEQHQVQVFSSNFSLYGDMSNRVMEILSGFSPQFEAYSIDEAFLLLNHVPKEEIRGVCEKIQFTIKKYLGIPISIGVAPTKVLAKLANRVAKKDFATRGIFWLFTPDEIEKTLTAFKVGDLWGIGHETTKKLHSLGIQTAQQFRDASEALIQKRFTIVGRRIQEELKGISCIDLNENLEPQKSLLCSRSFGKSVSEKIELQQAITMYITRAAERLRKSKLVCSNLQLFIATNRFKSNAYYGTQNVSLIAPTSSTPNLLKAALAALEDIFKEGLLYKRAGVLLSHLEPATHHQLGLFEALNPASERLMKTIDSINQKMGQDTIRFAPHGASQEWKMLCQMRSPAYTTRWSELLEVKI